jgi:serine/threonine protein kinase
VLLKNHGLVTARDRTSFLETGTYKKVTLALQVPLETHKPPILVAQAVSKSFDIYRDKVPPTPQNLQSYEENNQDWFNEVLNDIKWHKELSKKAPTGIWPFINYFTYEKTLKNNSKAPKVMSFSPLANATLFDIKFPLSLDQGIKVAYQLAQGLHYLHSNEFFHGDIKKNNVLFNQSTCTAGFTDFGLSSRITDPIQHPLPQGYYGSIVYTAPELFGNKKFKGDLFKLEIWALGYLFYEIFLEKVPCWEPILIKNGSNLQKEVQAEDIQLMNFLATQVIEVPRKVLVSKKDRSVEEEALLLIFDMMRIDPSLRLPSKEVVNRCEALLEKREQL